MGDFIGGEITLKLECTNCDLKADPDESEPIKSEDIKTISGLEAFSKDTQEPNIDLEDSCIIVIKPEIGCYTSGKRKIGSIESCNDETDFNPSKISHTQENDLENVRTLSCMVAYIHH